MHSIENNWNSYHLIMSYVLLNLSPTYILTDRHCFILSFPTSIYTIVRFLNILWSEELSQKINELKQRDNSFESFTIVHKKKKKWMKKKRLLLEINSLKKWKRFQDLVCFSHILVISKIFFFVSNLSSYWFLFSDFLHYIFHRISEARNLNSFSFWKQTF